MKMAVGFVYLVGILNVVNYNLLDILTKFSRYDIMCVGRKEMSKKSYAKFNIIRVMNWSISDASYRIGKEFKFKELKHYFELYFGLIKDGRKKK